MKKKYEKPGLIYESFELNQTIAESCGVTGGGNSLGTPSHWSKDTCGWSIGGNIVLWGSASNGCNDIVENDDGAPDGMCYNNPSPGQTIFSS
ncbi:MAG: hypothetical protein LUH02_01360 [Erysipelotrichaceae bacterium]|nr:hypothetical protein [Erysipelotrichaceae bacterium]